jgi:hypothetical protein
MERRKFIIGAGALATGSSAAVGTGALTTASAERSVNVGVASDSNAQIGLIEGNDPDIESNNGELELDLTGSNGEGVSINSTYTWGDPDNPSSEYAFKLVNNDESTYQGSGSGPAGEGGVTLSYDFSDTSWLDNGDDESYIRFRVFRPSDGRKVIDFTAPDQYRGNTNTYNGAMTDGSNSWPFAPGDQWFVVVSTNTTGSDATTSDDLSGNLTIEISDRN